MKRTRWIAALVAAALVGLVLILVGGDGGPDSAAVRSHTVATPPGRPLAEPVADLVGPVVADSAGAPVPGPGAPPRTPPTTKKPKPPLVGPGGLTIATTTTTTVKPGLDLDFVAPLSPAKLVRVTPGPLTLGAKGFAFARDLCLRNSGDLPLHWELATDVVFKSSPLSGELGGGDATCIKVWTVSPAITPGMTLPLVIDSSANSVSINVRLAD